MFLIQLVVELVQALIPVVVVGCVLSFVCILFDQEDLEDQEDLNEH